MTSSSLATCRGGALAAAILLTGGETAQAQSGGSDGVTGATIGAVEIDVANPSGDAAVNGRVTDCVRRAVNLFPGDVYSEERLTFSLGAARRCGMVANVARDLEFGPAGLTIRLNLTLGPAAERTDRGVFLKGDLKDLPTLYDRNGVFLKAKLESLAMYYGNNNAWYGRPDAMLNGNPLVDGRPAGKGYENWVEGFVHYGLYGIAPLTDELYIYGGLSAITAGSSGQELFTDRTRVHTDVEDAYVGLVAGRTTATGDRYVLNLSAGRQRFTLANGFLIANTAANGQKRAALQANARWAGDMVGLAQFSINNTKVEAFYVDPDELPLLDSKTRIAGVNLEFAPVAGLMVGGSYLFVPQSNAAYFGPTGTPIGTREGLRLYDVRFTWSPRPAGASGPFFGGELALQTHDDIIMRATAGYGEVGYNFTGVKWQPSVSYRLSHFSGDDPATPRYERWDPLLSGGNGEQWVQGANHFKVVQDSNVTAHRIQLRLRPSPRFEIVPQLWAFRADTLNNIGGNPALSVMTDREYGYEANVTGKWFASRNVYVHGHVAYTRPGDAVDAALNGQARDWLSVMGFVRYAF